MRHVHTFPDGIRVRTDNKRPEKYENVIEEVALYIFTEARRADNTAYNIGVVLEQYNTVSYITFAFEIWGVWRVDEFMN